MPLASASLRASSRFAAVLKMRLAVSPLAASDQ